LSPPYDLSHLGLEKDPYIGVLTGAGVSAESGVPTFRGEDGLWKSYRPEELATPRAFARDPVLVWEWYDWRRQVCAGTEPNPAHEAIADLDSAPVPLEEIPPRCECGALLRPDIVWFGEGLPETALQHAFEVCRSCDLMLVVGTSAVVQPAASMPLLAKQAGAGVIEVNPDTTPITPFVDLHFEGKAAEILPAIAAQVLSRIPGSP